MPSFSIYIFAIGMVSLQGDGAFIYDFRAMGEGTVSLTYPPVLLTWVMFTSTAGGQLKEVGSSSPAQP